eukprot:1178521-Prorocentrum_minimum.AAC.4
MFASCCQNRRDTQDDFVAEDTASNASTDTEYESVNDELSEGESLTSKNSIGSKGQSNKTQSRKQAPEVTSTPQTPKPLQTGNPSSGPATDAPTDIPDSVPSMFLASHALSSWVFDGHPFLSTERKHSRSSGDLLVDGFPSRQVTETCACVADTGNGGFRWWGSSSNQERGGAPLYSAISFHFISGGALTSSFNRLQNCATSILPGLMEAKVEAKLDGCTVIQYSEAACSCVGNTQLSPQTVSVDVRMWAIRLQRGEAKRERGL